MAAERYRMLALAVLVVGLLALAALPVGALGSRFGLWPFTRGFQFLFSGVYVAAGVLVLGSALLFFALRAGRSMDALPIGIGLAASIAVLLVVGWQYRLATTVPHLHNVSTDRADPPGFEAIAALRGAGTNPLDYGEREARAQAQGYPHIAPERSPRTAAESYARALAVARDFGWEIVRADDRRMLIEATATTFWFGYKDDVAIRVRNAEGGSGSVLDVRSVSRVGSSDLGANAKRIDAFLARFRE